MENGGKSAKVPCKIPGWKEFKNKSVEFLRKILVKRAERKLVLHR